MEKKLTSYRLSKNAREQLERILESEGERGRVNTKTQIVEAGIALISALRVSRSALVELAPVLSVGVAELPEQLEALLTASE